MHDAIHYHPFCLTLMGVFDMLMCENKNVALC